MSWIISVIFAGLLTAGAGENAPVAPLPNQNAVVAVADNTNKNAPENNDPIVIEEKFEQTYPLDANGRVSLSNVNGNVTIDAWDKNEARVFAVKRVDCDRPVDLEVKIDASATELRVETVYPQQTWTYNGGKNSKSTTNGYENRCRQLSVEYSLTLPRNARLDQIETVNGNVNLSGMTDVVKVATVNGRIFAANLRGTVNLSSVNGTLDADFESLENVREIKLDIINGTVNLTLPSDADATFKAETISGQIGNDFGLIVRKGEYVGRDLHGKLGGGTLPVKLNGINGAINIRRRNDGRQVKPMTNLLPAQNSDNSQSIAPKPPKPPRLRGNPNPAPPSLDNMNEEIRAAVEESVEAAREYAKIDAEAIRNQVRAEVEQARAEVQMRRAEATLKREFAFDFGSPRFPATTRRVETFKVEGSPEITIEAENGSVVVRGWDKPEISYALVRSSDKEMQFEVVKRDSKGLKVKASSNDGEDYKIEIFVPRNSDLRIKTNKQIRVEGVTGELKLDGEDQSIDVRDAGGNLTAATNCGRIRVIGFDGAANAKTIDGDIALEGSFAAVTTDNANGTTSLTVGKNAAAQITAPFDRVTFDTGINVYETDPKFRRIGAKNAGDKDGKFALKTVGGQIYIRNAENVRVLRNQRAAQIKIAG